MNESREIATYPDPPYDDGQPPNPNRRAHDQSGLGRPRLTELGRDLADESIETGRTFERYGWTFHPNGSTHPIGEVPWSYLFCRECKDPVLEGMDLWASLATAMGWTQRIRMRSPWTGWIDIAGRSRDFPGPKILKQATDLACLDGFSFEVSRRAGRPVWVALFYIPALPLRSGPVVHPDHDTALGNQVYQALRMGGDVPSDPSKVRGT